MEQTPLNTVAAADEAITPPRAATAAPLPIWSVPDEFIDITDDTRTLQGIDRALGYFGNEPYVVFAYEPRAGEVIWKDGLSCGFAHGAWDVMSAKVGPVARDRGTTLGEDGVAGSHVLLVDRSRGRAYLAEAVMGEVFLCAIYGFSRTRCIDPGRWALRQRRQQDGGN